MVLPLGLLALNWLRLYLPLVSAGLPQVLGNRSGNEGLGFAGAGWRALTSGALSLSDIQVGSTFTGDDAKIIHSALREAADHIRDMPARYLTFQSGVPVFKVLRNRTLSAAISLSLDGPFLNSFGSMRVPATIWRAMQRFAVWIEPALVTEWMKKMRDYAVPQGRQLDEVKMAAAMTWSEPARNTNFVRSLALERIATGKLSYCVWSGKRLNAGNVDIDHCLPWSVWPCSDLWNLIPSERSVNQQSKRDRIPSAEALRVAADAMMSWWTTAYLGQERPLLP